MAYNSAIHKTPLRVQYNDSDTPTGISEYQATECIPVNYGGTGQSDVSRGQVIIGDISDTDYKLKKITDTTGNISAVFDETWITLTGSPTNSDNATSKFFIGETIWVGSDSSNPSATGIVVETMPNVSTTVKVKSIIGTFANGDLIRGQNSLYDSNKLRTATISNATDAISEQSAITFMLGTINSATGNYEVDCGTIS